MVELQKGTSQEATKIGSGMGKLICLIVPPVQIDKYALVVDAGDDSDACACELGTELIEATSRDAFLGTIDVVGRYRRVVGSLLGEIRYGNLLASGRALSGYEVGFCFMPLKGRGGILNFPSTLTYVSREEG